jgi:hypothetical protein
MSFDMHDPDPDPFLRSSSFHTLNLSRRVFVTKKSRCPGTWFAELMLITVPEAGLLYCAWALAPKVCLKFQPEAAQRNIHGPQPHAHYTRGENLGLIMFMCCWHCIYLLIDVCFGMLLPKLYSSPHICVLCHCIAKTASIVRATHSRSAAFFPIIRFYSRRWTFYIVDAVECKTKEKSSVR